MKFVVLRFENDADADLLVRDMTEWPDDDLLTPCQENFVHAMLVGVYPEAVISEINRLYLGARSKVEAENEGSP